MRSDFGLSSVVRRFADALPIGLASASLFFGGLLPRPSFKRFGTEADWESVGDDLTTAMAPYAGAAD